MDLIGGNLALDFINTIDNRLGDAKDRLIEPGDLAAWASRAKLPNARMARSFDDKALAQVRAIREELYAILRAIALGRAPPAKMLEVLNDRLIAAAPARRLAHERGEFRWRWHAGPNDAVSFVAPILAAALELLTSDVTERLRECRGTYCGWLFLDRSKGGQRRWCSMSDCGNRAKAQRFSARNS